MKEPSFENPMPPNGEVEPRGLYLIKSDIEPDEPFFTADLGKTPDLNRLITTAQAGRPEEILLAALEEVGLTGQPEQVELYQQRLAELTKQAELDSDQAAEFERLDTSLRGDIALRKLIAHIRDYYMQEFWEDPAGGRVDQEDRKAKLIELYGKSDDFLESPLLQCFDRLQQNNEVMRNEPLKAKINEADRIARLLILNEVYE